MNLLQGDVFGAAPDSFAMPRVPRDILQTSPVSIMGPSSDGGARAGSLPLNLIALIVSYLEDRADIARVCRTSRLLYYMTLPQLYEQVILHSHNDIRYVNGRPEGFGSGSPFTMALNGLVTKQYAGLVKSLRILGNWKEVGVEEFAQGRVPDGIMMLNILLRAALDKMAKLEIFSWELDCKPLKPLYQGLSGRSSLTSLTIKFPSSRSPRPAVLIPPIPSLKFFKATDIDPLCYPDDISLLLLHSRQLDDIRIHFSPRMRDEAESSLSLRTYFGRCFSAGFKIPASHFAMQNFFGQHDLGFDRLFSASSMKSVTFIDTFGGAKGGAANVFMDDSWKMIPGVSEADFHTIRCNEMASQHVQIIEKSKNLEKMYFINARKPTSVVLPQSPTSPITPSATPGLDHDTSSLGNEYIHVLSHKHGSKLKHLLLNDHWALSTEQMGDLIRYCPNLEQLGLAVDTSNHATLRLLVPFLPKLHSIRILDNGSLCEHSKAVSDEQRLAGMSRELWKAGCENLKYIGIGDRVYKTGQNYEAIGEDGKLEMRREVTRITLDNVQHVEIWGLDKLEI